MDSIKVSVSKNEAKKTTPKKEPVTAPVKTDQPKKTRSSGIFGKLITTAIVTALIIGAGSYYWSSSMAQEQVDKAKGELNNIKSDLETKITDLQNKVAQVETENSDLKTNKEQLEGLTGLLEQAKREFDSPELGLKFEYPANYGDVKWTIEKGPVAGKIFSATFTGNDKIVLGGITEDYSASGTDQFILTQGYQRSGGKYYFLATGKTKPTDFLITPLKVIKVSGNDILIVDISSFATSTPHSTGDNSLGALVNLKGKDFGGLAVWDKDLENIPQADFEKIINSIEIR